MRVNKIFQILLISAGAFTVSCTDLELTEKESVVTSSGGDPTAKLDAGAALTSVYGSFENYTDQQGIYALGEHTSGEMIPPTRGTDWGDNGVWRTLDLHTWDGTNSWIINAWNDLNGAAYKCNEVLAAKGVVPNKQQIAEAKFLRAFFQWHVMDFWGQVPVREVTDGVNISPKVYQRAAAYDVIMKDLTDALPDLPAGTPKAQNRTANQAACKYMMAVMLLNKHIYTGKAAVEAADMAQVVKLVDEIKAAGFGYETNYFDNFKAGSAKERIFSTNKGIGPQRRWCMTTHYDQETGGWNGFTTLADFYDKFDNADPRKGEKYDFIKDSTGLKTGFLVGTMYNKDGKPVVNKRSNNAPLVFTRDVTLGGAANDKGIRVIKYHPKTSGDYVLLRFGAAQMMKAEALFRSGNAAGAVAAMNELRTARGFKTVTAVTEDELFDEWGRETYWEGHKRTCEIRFNKFLTGPGVGRRDAETLLFAIPSSAVVANPNLKQNLGYK